MRLDHDLAIRRAVGSIISDDVAMGVGDGWYRLVTGALSEIWDTAGEAGTHVEVTHIEQKRGSLVIRTTALGRRVPKEAADAINEIRFNAADRSSAVCERCGSLGFVIRGDEPRVRCGRCEAEEVARQAIHQEYRGHVAEACLHYIHVCIEHERLFPVENVVMQVAPMDETAHYFFLDEVHERLTWWRACSWIEGVDEALREDFRRLDFV